MYANGRGVVRDDSVAVQLFTMASEQGHMQARGLLQYIRASDATPLPACLLPEPAAVEMDALPESPGDMRADLATEGWSLVEMMYIKSPIYNLVYRLAPDYEVDPKLALAVIFVESRFNIRATSPKNAQGLMQLIPETAQRFRVKNAYDPVDNVKGGLAYLQWLLAYFKGDVPLVAAAYNAGERTVEKYRGIPPYPETKDYVRKITDLYRSPTHPYNAKLVEPAKFVTKPARTGD
jgi:hypothetical protein